MAATASSSSGSTAEIEYPPASNGESLQLVFSQHCNTEGLMSEKDMRNVPAIKDMLVSDESTRSLLYVYFAHSVLFLYIQSVHMTCLNPNLAHHLSIFILHSTETRGLTLI